MQMCILHPKQKYNFGFVSTNYIQMDFIYALLYKHAKWFECKLVYER